MSKQYPGGIISKTPVTPSGPYNIDTASGVWTLEQQAYWQRLGQWPTAGNSPTDPQFNYVTMLLHGDGTNGAQNNTFLDSSPNTYTMTRSGLATQGSFSPYGSNWSNYLGSGNSIYISTGSVFAFTAAFTIEAWVFLNSTSGAVDPRLINIGGGIDILFVNSTKAVQVKNNATTVLTSSSSAVSLNTWSHIAVVRNGSTLTIYVNGTSVGSATYSTTFSDAGDARIARQEGAADGYLDGYISNLRIVKGSAVYTTNFTPSTTPLTAITNTVLLTCQSNRFVDNSASPFGLTPSGTPSVQRFNPFGASAPYSTNVIGGSAYFDGSSSIAGPNSTQIDFSTNNFTIEFWLYYIGGEDVTGTFTGGTSGRCYQIFVNGNQVRIRLASTGGLFWNYGVAGTLAPNTWNHVALCRSGSTFRTFLNGVAGDTTTNADPMNTYTGNIQIGRSQYYVIGYIADYRIVNGTALYTSAFTPPTSPLTAVTNTALLNSFTNAGIFDNAMMNDLETVSNAQISTSVKKYGTGSLAFDGTGDRLTSASSPNIAFGTGDFTIEAWIYSLDVSDSTQRGWLQTSSTAGGLATSFTDGVTFVFGTPNGTGTINAIVGGTNYASAGGTVTTSTWYHIAVTRASGAVKLFVNGTSVASGTGNTANLSGQFICIGGYYSTSYLYNGYIDDLRITKGFARYTANFTPPTAALFDFSPT